MITNVVVPGWHICYNDRVKERKHTYCRRLRLTVVFWGRRFLQDSIPLLDHCWQSTCQSRVGETRYLHPKQTVRFSRDCRESLNCGNQICEFLVNLHRNKKIFVSVMVSSIKINIKLTAPVVGRRVALWSPCGPFLPIALQRSHKQCRRNEQTLKVARVLRPYIVDS